MYEINCDLQPSRIVGPLLGGEAEGGGVGFKPSHLTKRDWYSVSDTGLLEYFIPNPFPHIYCCLCFCFSWIASINVLFSDVAVTVAVFLNSYLLNHQSFSQTLRSSQKPLTTPKVRLKPSEKPVQ